MRNKSKRFLLKMWTMVMSMFVVLSFSLISVYALPADYTVVGTNSDLINFDDGTTGTITKENGAVFECSTEKRHSGTHSLKLTGVNSYGRIRYNEGVEFKTNSTYYVSFWYYSDGWGGNNGSSGANANPTGNANGGSRGTVYHSSNATGQWNKVWFIINTGSAIEREYFNFCFWGNQTIYIDDFYVAEISNAAGLVNTIPDGAAASVTGTQNFENAIKLTNGNSNAIPDSATGFSAHNTTNTTVVASADYSHWGNLSLKLSASADEGASVGLYANTKTGFSSEVAMDAGTYYLSYYVYSPDAAMTHSAGLINGKTIVPSQTIPQGQWTKVQTIFTIDETLAATQNIHLLKLYATNLTDKAFYFDDFVLAKLTTDFSATLTASNVNYDFETKAAEVTVNSSVELTSAGTVTVAGDTVDYVSLSQDGKTITATLSNVDAGRNYTLSFSNVTDAYNRTHTLTAGFETPSAYAFTNEGISVTEGVAGYHIDIASNRASGSFNIAVMVASYDANGVMLSVGMDDGTVTGGAALPTSFEVSNLTAGTVYKAFIFDWDTFQYIYINENIQ